MATVDIDHHPLLIAPALQMVGAIPLSVLWIVGDHWVKCEAGEFYIDADEHVTYGDVRGLLMQTQGDAHQWLT